MLAVSGCGNYILIALQVLNVDGFEDCELSTKFRAETGGDMKKIMAYVSDIKITQATRKSGSFGFITPYKGKIGRLSSR